MVAMRIALQSSAYTGSGETPEDIPMSIFTRFLNDQSGATAIEYGLIAALVSVAAIAAMTTLGTKLTSTFEAVSNRLK
jgi:pilus assembly protein Flp/PilA